jgi:hypothetical protein
LFHNANFFGSCTIRILYTGCAEIKKNNSGAKGLSIACDSGVVIVVCQRELLHLKESKEHNLGAQTVSCTELRQHEDTEM